MSIRQTGRSIAMFVPPVRRLVAHRDGLLQEADQLRIRLSAVEQERHHFHQKLAELQSFLEKESEDSVQQRQDIQQRLSELQSLAQKNFTGSVLDAYATEPPSRALAFRIFDGAWSSDIPGYGFGHARLFDDPRVNWMEQQCGGFRGKRILELGPLEGGHTSTMSSRGAASVTSIEANTNAFLKCLIVQNALKFEADFQLGDFCRFLEACNEQYDFLLACGVLYHMMEPVRLLQNIARVTTGVGIWTHYYDAEIVLGRDDLEKKFDSEPTIERIGEREVVLHKQSYLDALQWKGFNGGAAPTSYWLTRDGLIGLLTDLGFEVTVGQDDRYHQNGPAILLFAQKTAEQSVPRDDHTCGVF